ncbi:MAG: M15 family metallopeptidase, partial [Syntrophomonas sp.]
KDNFIQAFTYIKNGTATINGRQVSLLSLVKTMDGTFVTRHVNWNPARGLSNHSWGTAIDINADSHFRYVDPGSEPYDPNLILWEKAFKPAGFSWGNSYSDSMHFELLK